MLETASAKKTKINLSEYNFREDIANRLLLKNLSPFDLEILEEILFSPLHIPIKKLADGIDSSKESLLPSLQSLEKTGLLTIQGDLIEVDKEKRKYFEHEILRFLPDFHPDMEFIQGMLKKVPIHLLPSWYAIPRTSSNIFASLVEKFLLTPQIFQRHFSDVMNDEFPVGQIATDLFHSPSFSLSIEDLQQKYSLSPEELEETLLFLEFNFIASSRYHKEKEGWQGEIVLFTEWKEYLIWIQSTQPLPLPVDEIVVVDSRPFGFLEDLSTYLKNPFEKKFPPKTQERLEAKLLQLQFISLDAQRFSITSMGNSWLEMDREQRALYLYRSPHNLLILPSIGIINERIVRESEKMIKRILDGRWVLMEDLIGSATLFLSEESLISLKKEGKRWQYSRPVYSESEKEILKQTLRCWLFEMGMIQMGDWKGQECCSLSDFGKYVFAN